MGASGQRQQVTIAPYDKQHHIGSRPKDIVELFHALDDFSMNIAAGSVHDNILPSMFRY